MKKIILPISFIILLFAFGGIGGATTSKELTEAAFKRFLSGEIAVRQVHIRYSHYLHPFWNEELKIENGMIRLHKSVHNSAYFSVLRAQIMERGYTAPYEERLLKTEEGDYDSYYKTEFDPDKLVPFINALEQTDFYNMESLKGDHEIWTIEIEIDGASKVVTTVVLKDTPGFEKLIVALKPLMDDVRKHQVDKDEFDSSEMN